MARRKGSANVKSRISKNLVRDAQIQFRCTAQQKEMINRLSIETNTSVADLILKAVLKYSLTSYEVIRTGIEPGELNEVF